MKPGVFVSLMLVSASLFLLSAGSLVLNYVEQPGKAKAEMEMNVVLRQVGHTLLLHTNDSTSRVMPVKQIGTDTYQISFENEFAFMPDSLVTHVQQALSKLGFKRPYTVHVINCVNSDVVYGFQVGLSETTTIVPCLGREQPNGCYRVNISFLHEPFPQRYLYGLVIAGAALVFVGGKRLVKKGSQIKTGTNTIRIGTYTFIPEQRMLQHAKNCIELSDKETKLLIRFAAHLNLPIPREQLMKEVWQDEGIIVGRSLDVFVSKLRKKLRADATVQLINIHGLGYSLKVLS